MENKKYLITSGISAVLTALLMILIKTVDVADIGPEGTRVGLSHINSFFWELTGVNMLWYEITTLLGIAAILTAAFFALLGLMQLVQRKSILKVDRELLFLAGIYAAVIIIYIFFEKVIFNYRPVIMPDNEHPEASFPSSHTMVVCVVMGCALMLTDRYIKQEKLRTVLKVVCAVVLGLTVAGRLISGVHWFTDILGGLFISGMLLSLYRYLIYTNDK